MNSLDIEACRQQRPYTRKEYVARVLWSFAGPLFRWSPRPCFSWRNQLLRLFGAEIGVDVHIYPSAHIYLPWKLKVGNSASVGEWALIYNLGRVVIGERATISHRTHLCAGTHDYTDPEMPLVRAGIEVKPQSWVCADAFVGPGVTIGEGAIVGAAAVITRDVLPWTIVAGNPAKEIKMRQLRKPANRLDRAS